MSLAVYVHIPYCLQRCRYCDFATFEFNEILPPERYTDWVRQEIRNRRHFWPQSEIQTLYFGGGTPSLISPELIVAIKNELAMSGFSFRTTQSGQHSRSGQHTAELTLEINPATIDEAKLNRYLEAGFNRFSVGAQTFNDDLLKLCGRKHTAADTHSTLQLLQRYKVNYSFDLLFALPGQTLKQVEHDLEVVGRYSPPHLSAYCLTVPQGHPMSSGRAPENEQVAMFEAIERSLKPMGLEKYEISNFAKPGFESRHNGIYWNDQSYWGIGLSSHSYSRESGPYGLRFWNPKSIALYGEQALREGPGFEQLLPADQWEKLQLHESLTDFCHMHLRTHAGLPGDALQGKYPAPVVARTLSRLDRLVKRGWVEALPGRWRLTAEGQMISNKVFEELCFLPNELRAETLTPQGADSYCAV